MCAKAKIRAEVNEDGKDERQRGSSGCLVRCEGAIIVELVRDGREEGKELCSHVHLFN